RPWVTSGIRLGSSAATARGFGVEEFTRIADWVADIVGALESSDPEPVISSVIAEVSELTARFPMYRDD
ncbi:MAG TPA: serine hydroxymethyltransferase, partial [Acidimicrobiales bacterium]|nr:serine hydroxymethyltransferase [Acidimicrobiales bacterium]